MADRRSGTTKRERTPEGIEVAAGNGLLHRRLFLKQGAAALGAGSLGLMTAAQAKELPPWMRAPGKPLSGYGSRSAYEDHVQRQPLAAKGTDGAGGSWTPLEALEGMITPNPLHFERHHSGIPDIDPSRHRLLIHGMGEARPVLRHGRAFTLPDGLAHSVHRVFGQQLPGGLAFRAC